MDQSSSKRARLSSSGLPDVLWLLTWSFLACEGAALQQCVCREWRRIMVTGTIPSAVDCDLDYEMADGFQAFLARYRRLRSVKLCVGWFLPLDPGHRLSTLSAAARVSRIAVSSGSPNHETLDDATTFVIAARHSLKRLVLPFRNVGGTTGRLAWRRFCVTPFAVLHTLDLGTDTVLADHHLVPLHRSPFIPKITTLTLAVRPQEKEDRGLDRLFCACTALTDLTIAVHDANQWCHIAKATKLQHIKVKGQPLDPRCRCDRWCSPLCYCLY